MTSPIVPQFIFDMFEREIIKINSVIVHRICQEYHLDEEEVKQKLANDLAINFNIIHEDIEQIKIIKKHKPKSQTVKSKPCGSKDVPHQDENDASESDNDTENKSVVETTALSTQCEARVFIAADLIVKQCSRPKLEGGNLCKLHQRLKNEGKLKYGTMQEEKPACISTAKLNMKVRRKIY
jgi:hypothetical protein